MTPLRPAARAASDYYNSLPFEQRRKLAPLLEDYRRLGIEEALRELHPIRNKLQQRVRDIQNGRTLPTESP
jgi:hypothetical protein